MANIIDFILHINEYIYLIIQNYGTWVYFIFFLVVFCETGLVVVPFLPGDSLLFASGAFAAIGLLDIRFVFLIFLAAAVLGDTANYHIGKFLGPKVFSSEHSRFLNREQLERTHRFYQRHGAFTIIIARFMPFIRTFAPFVAGIGDMSYMKFLSYNFAGGTAWVSLFVFAGYFFGNIPAIKDNFSAVVYAIVFISILPALITFLKNRRSQVQKE